MTFTLGSRSSQLALVQTHIVRDALQKLHPDYTFPIVTMNTAGDKNQLSPDACTGAGWGNG